MTKVIGVRFRDSGKVYYFDPQDLPLKDGQQVIVETSRGTECGRVVLCPREVTEEKVNQPLRPILRIATEEDCAREAENRESEKEAYAICQKKIAEHNLDMKLIKCEYAFDRKKVLFYFTADGRVDFRDLVKDLASAFKARIELRQVGVRDETRLLGGIGICGRPLCCSTFLSDFSSVSIRMAKEQNLSLNPTKISGSCGRLMCCLKNEQETYEYLNKNMPGVGDVVKIRPERPGESEENTEEVSFEEEGVRIGEVHSVNILRQSARVVIEVGDDREIEEVPASRLEVVMTRQKKNRERAKERERLQKEQKEQREKAKRERAQQASGEKRERAQTSGEGGAQTGGEEGAEKGEGRKREGGRRRRNRRRRDGGHAEGAEPKNGGSAPEQKSAAPGQSE